MVVAGLQGLDVGFEDATGGALVQADFGADLAGDPGDLAQRQAVQVVALAGERDQQVLLAWLAATAAARQVWSPAPSRRTEAARQKSNTAQAVAQQIGRLSASPCSIASA